MSPALTCLEYGAKARLSRAFARDKGPAGDGADSADVRLLRDRTAHWFASR
jgi:hypothetical protein